MLQAQ